MSGDVGLSTSAKQIVEKKRSSVTAFEKKIGMPALPADLNECTYLNITGDQINRMSPEERLEAASSLASYGFYVQRMLSKEKGILRWLESKINMAIANELNDYAGYYSHNQRRDVAIANNVYAKELEEMRLNSQIKVDMLEGLPYQINQISRILLESQRNKNA